MNHILICGAAGFTNLGDDAILWGMLTQLREVMPGRAIRVVGGPELGPLVEGFAASRVSYDDRAELARAIEDAALVIVGGGGLLYDIGYDAGLERLLRDSPDRQWLYEMALLAAAAGTAGRPMMMYAVGVGPLMTEGARQVARFIGEQATAVTVRDHSSAKLLAECGLAHSRLHVAADPAVMVEPASDDATRQVLEGCALAQSPKPWLALNLRPWGDREQVGQLVSNAAKLVRGLRERTGGTVVLLPLQREYDDDRSVLQEVAEQADASATVMLDPPPFPPHLVALIREMDIVVGMRLHALVLALAAGTPFVALTYDAKVDEFARAAELGEHVHAADSFEPDAVIASCQRLLRDRQTASARLMDKRDELRERAALSADLAREILETSRAAVHLRLPERTQDRPPDEIRILMQTRPDYSQISGGDVVQMNETRRCLERLGAKVDVSTEETPDLSDYDLVHAFNLGRPHEPYLHCMNAAEQGKPIALSTVYWDLWEFWQWGNTSYWELPPAEQGLPRIQEGPPPGAIEVRRRAHLDHQRQAAIEWATVYLPNGQGEADCLHEAYGMDLSCTVIVPNAVADIFFDARPEPFVEQHGVRDFVLCAARVEEKKNQLCLVAALRGTGIPLVIVGQANPEQYRELCRRYADDNVVFLDAMDHEELASAYAAAKVHALVGWFETPGLSTLEAAAAGCNIVSTDRGLAREYLGDMAWYCDPRSMDSIREAVVAAFGAPRTGKLREHVRHNYTWERAAERTLEGYRLALDLDSIRRERAPERGAIEAARMHADLLARLAADREYEARRMREWAERVQAEYDRVTARLFYRWSAHLARAGWSILRALGVKQ